MTQHATFPEQPDLQSAPNFPAPDYGPFGKVPSSSDVVYFGETWGARSAPKVFIVLGSLLTFFGLLALPGGISGASAALLIIGIAFIVIGWFNGKSQVHVDLVCDRCGVTIRRFDRKEGASSSKWIPWDTVSATRYTVRQVETQSTEGGKTTSYIQEFAIDAGGKTAFQTDEKMTKGLPDFIELCNRSIPRLGYRWIPKKAAAGLPVIETVYKYVKVPL